MAADIIDLKDRMKNTVDKKTVAVKVQDLKEAYALISPLTNLPYVECEQENFFDQVLLYETKEDAEAAAKVYGEKGIRVLVRDLKTLELELPVKPEEPDGEKRKVFLNQVRQHLGILPFMGVNAVCYKAADAPAELIELENVLPEDFQKKVAANALYQPNLQLTGVYLMQEARKGKDAVDRKVLHDLDEEFSSNLVKAKVFMPVLPPKGKEKDPQLNLKECQIPYLKHQNGDLFFPVFTDVWEFQKYAKDKKNLRSIQIPFKELEKFWVEDAKAYMINPHGFALPIPKDMVPKLLKRFGVE